LAFSEQGRRPDRADSKRSRRDDVDANGFGEPLRFLDPRFGGSPRSLSRKLGDGDDRALAASNVGDRRMIEAVQPSSSADSLSSLPKFNGCAG
jgi:hypothetical protein